MSDKQQPRFNFSSVDDLKNQIIKALNRKGIGLNQAEELWFKSSRVYILVRGRRVFVVIRENDTQTQLLCIHNSWVKTQVESRDGDMELAYELPVRPEDTL